jgi:hypothetical protein
MRGSLAVWCETFDDKIKDHAPKLELHLNIWLDIDKAKHGVLDIGIRFIESRTITKTYIFVPAALDQTHISDLHETLKDSKTLSAIFNDVLEFLPLHNDDYQARKDGEIQLRVVKIGDDMSIKPLDDTSPKDGTVICLDEGLFNRLDGIEDQYVRLRIRLNKESASAFTISDVPTDRAFFSTFYNDEIIELRINERRNFNEKLRETFKGMCMPEFSAIHYFLIRNLSAEFLRSHADFKKMRLLEPNLWNRYLNEFGSVSVEKMIIYHWRAIAVTDKSIEDFIAFAHFRKARTNLIIFIVTLALLGALGSLTQATILAAVQHHSPSDGWRPYIVSFSLLGIALLSVWLILNRSRMKKIFIIVKQAILGSRP